MIVSSQKGITDDVNLNIEREKFATSPKSIIKKNCTKKLKVAIEVKNSAAV